MANKKEINKKNRDFENRLKLYKLITGFVSFMFLLFINAYVKELPVWYLVAPAFLLGINPEHFIKK